MDPQRTDAPDNDEAVPDEPIDLYLAVLAEAGDAYERLPADIQESIASASLQRQRQRMVLALTWMPPASRRHIAERLAALRVSRLSAAAPQLTLVRHP